MAISPQNGDLAAVLPFLLQYLDASLHPDRRRRLLKREVAQMNETPLDQKDRRGRRLTGRLLEIAFRLRHGRQFLRRRGDPGEQSYTQESHPLSCHDTLLFTVDGKLGRIVDPFKRGYTQVTRVESETTGKWGKRERPARTYVAGVQPTGDSPQGTGRPALARRGLAPPADSRGRLRNL